MNEREWKRLKVLYKKHVAMARKIGWRVYRGPHGPAGNSGRYCPFSHFPEWFPEPPFALQADGVWTQEWRVASLLWGNALEDPARIRKEFGWRVEH